MKDQPWFTTVPVGKNTSAKMAKEVYAEAGVGGQRSNHSLRATGATELYQAGVPENVIQERTGHLSLTGLCEYKHTSGEQQAVVSRILASKAPTVYHQQLSMTQSHSFMPVQQMMPIAPQYNFQNPRVTINQQPPIQPQVETSTSLANTAFQE